MLCSCLLLERRITGVKMAGTKKNLLIEFTLDCLTVVLLVISGFQVASK
jgi:hypothetical protein